MLALVADLDGRRRHVLLEFRRESCLSRLLARAQQPEAEGAASCLATRRRRLFVVRRRRQSHAFGLWRQPNTV